MFRLNPFASQKPKQPPGNEPPPKQTASEGSTLKRSSSEEKLKSKASSESSISSGPKSQPKQIPSKSQSSSSKSKSSSSESAQNPKQSPQKSTSASSSSSVEESSISSKGTSNPPKPKVKPPPSTPKKPTSSISTSSSPERQPIRRPKVPRRPKTVKKSQYELKTGGGTFYVIQKPSNDDKRNQYKRTQSFYKESRRDEQGNIQPAGWSEEEPAFFSPAFNETTYEQNGQEPTYSELAEWNRESYTKFIQEPAVRFARAVAGKIDTKWQELFENPDEALIDYRKNTIPRDIDNLFGKVDIQAVFDTLKVALLDPNTPVDQVEAIKNKAVKDLETLKTLWNLASSAQQRAKEVVAREVFLTNVYHAPYVIFAPPLQTAIDTVISHIKDKCPQVKDFDKTIIFGHLIESDTWLSPFVEAVANRMIDSRKARGYSRSLVQARYDALQYTQLIAKFMNNYKFDDTYINRGTDKTLEALNKSLGI